MDAALEQGLLDALRALLRESLVVVEDTEIVWITAPFFHNGSVLSLAVTPVIPV